MRLSPMIYLYIALGLAAFLWFLWAFSADAAEFRVVEGKTRTHVFLEGKLQREDWGRFMVIVRDKKLRDKYTLHLNSGGGSVLTGLRLGSLVRKQGIKTFISSHSTCASACYLIFIAGYDMDRGRHDRWKHRQAKLGIHSPRFRTEKANTEVNRTFISELLRRHLARYDAGQGVYEKMMGTPFDKMHYFTNRELEKLGGYGIIGKSPRNKLYDALMRKYRPGSTTDILWRKSQDRLR